MKLITKNTDYAIQALACIAGRKEKTVSAKELGTGLKIPRPFLRKILQRLNKKGLLRSHRGLGGGFMLARSPGKIRVTDLMEIFQGPFVLNEHFLRGSLCPRRKTCILKKKIDAIEKRVLSDLKAISIASLIRGRA